VLSGCAPGTAFAPQDPQTAQMRVERGISLLSARDYSSAKAELMKAQALKTGDERALMALAVAADMDGDFKLSDRAYELLLIRTKDQVMLFNNMGYSYMLRGDLVKAASYLQEAARRDPSNSVVRNNLKMLRLVTPV
jgi:Flp pilus assembly protein TadD